MLERWEFIQRQKSNEAGAEIARVLREQYGDEPLDSKSEFTPQALEAEVERQAINYVLRDFHKRLRMSQGRFKDHVMGLVVPQSETFRGRFDIPVVAFGQIPATEQARLAGIDYYLDGSQVSDWKDDPKGYKTPKKSYLTWMQDGKVNLNRKPTEIRNSFAADERGATQYDGIGLYVARPQVLQDHFVDLPGTVVGSGRVALLGLWHGRPLLGSYLSDDAVPGWGSASCGRV